MMIRMILMFFDYSDYPNDSIDMVHANSGIESNEAVHFDCSEDSKLLESSHS